MPRAMNAGRFALVALLCLFSLPAPNARATSNAYAPHAISNHLQQLQVKAGRGFTVLWQPPFAIAGDVPPATARWVATNTVAWATARLKRRYFTNDPKEIVDIWLFKDDQSYRRHALRLFEDRPSTPFGYYSPRHRALVMNISTGTGTLVHEMVHAFTGANFPGCPAWFNEGFASLYEQCGEKNGEIVGYPNWRLPKLQEAIRAGKVPTFDKFTALTTDEFYGRKTGANYNEQYAQARYLCYYLQERGLLHRFHREFIANVARDPTGLETLKKVLGETDWQLFQKKWETFVLLLKAP
jgi:hypothetical protein